MKVCKETSKCGVGLGVGAVVVMEVTQVGVRVRDRAPATTEEMTENLGIVKRRKISIEKLRSPSLTLVESSTIECEIEVDCCSGGGGRSCGVPASCCCSSESVEQLKVSDLEKSVEIGANASNDLDGCESTPKSDFAGESESTAAKQTTVMNDCRRRVLPAEKKPPEAEIEEFFAAAQEVLNERFKNKYNYDIVNDIPLKGRFEWIQVTPKNDDDDHEDA